MQTPDQPRRLPLTQTAHAHLRQTMQAWRALYAENTQSQSNTPPPALLAIDATAGNGHDTVFLARLLGSQGEVAAFDIQPQALANTAARLQQATLAATTPPEANPGKDLTALCDASPKAGAAAAASLPLQLAKVRLVEASHAEMLSRLPSNWRGSACLITFNLGYLPGADKGRVTLAESTLPALDAALQLLAPHGLLSILCYRGHPEGQTETTAIHHWLATLPQGYSHEWITASPDAPAHAPVLLHIRRDHS